ncbi:MAG TPA: hypothetical protein VGN09_28110 [Vicinamibacteria bacterium]|jgi:hypothetical protein
MRPAASRYNHLRIIAQDPGVLDRQGRILTARVALPPEYLADGPWGYRVQVIDFDASTDKLYPAHVYQPDPGGAVHDPFADTDPGDLVGDPHFHAQNVYALVMNTLTRFEKALGRRVNWGFGGHQLKVVPHAFADANAFYSRNDEALLFGYFEARDGGTIHTCLSHDVIVHETTHALLDGLRARFIDPSSPDQAAFHEGFADVVALLSVFSLPGVVEEILARKSSEKGAGDNLIPVGAVDPENLKASALLGLAEQMGDELTAARGKALRHSVSLTVSADHIKKPEFQVAHRRGEILVAAVMNAFVRAWSDRMTDLRAVSDGYLDLQRVAEEGRDAADYLLTMTIRALDYTPPIHLEFCDYLSATVTADLEVRPDDSRYRFRKHLRSSFRDFGIDAAQGTFVPTQEGQTTDPRTTAVQPPEDGAWIPCSTLALVYDRTHSDPLTRDVDEVFRFIWENRGDLELTPDAFSQVLSVRPSLRVGPDGFVLRETVAEFYQVLRLRPSELVERWKLALPAELTEDDEIPLYGGGTLIFDEYGRLKFYIHNSLDNVTRQKRRLDHLLARGALPERGPRTRDFSRIHRLRGFDAGDPREEW